MENKTELIQEERNRENNNLILNRDLKLAEEIAQRAAAEGGRVYFVGGCVRDRILGNKYQDVDIEVHGIAQDKLYRILCSLGIVTEDGISYGIYGLKDYKLDIALPRMEKAVGKGHKDFEVIVNAFLGTEKAAVRRDFTVNALMEDVLTGEVIDHFGGLEDLKNRKLRHISPEMFVEDPLRVLRAAQFAARFQFSVDDETAALAKNMDLKTLARERVFGEMKKALLRAEKPSIFFKELRKMNQLRFWFKELEDLIEIEQNPLYHPEGNVWNHTMMVLDEAAKNREQAKHALWFMMAALCHDFGKAVATEEKNGKICSYGHEVKGLPLADNFLKRIVRETALSDYVKNMMKYHMKPNACAMNHSKTKTTNRMFDESICPEDLILLAKADHMGRGGEAAKTFEAEKYLKQRLEYYYETMEKPYVMGTDLIEAGLKPGPIFSELTKYAHKLRLAGVKKETALKQVLAYEKEIRKR